MKIGIVVALCITLFTCVYGQVIANSANVDKGGNDWAWRAKHGILRLLWHNGYMVAPDSPVARALAGLVDNGRPCPTPACPPATAHYQLPTATSSAPEIWYLEEGTTARRTEAAATASQAKTTPVTGSTETAPAASTTAMVTQSLTSPWFSEALNYFKSRSIWLGIGSSIVFFGTVTVIARLGKAPPYIDGNSVCLEAQPVDYSSSDDGSSMAPPTNTRRRRQHHIRRIAATFALSARLKRLRRSTAQTNQVECNAQHKAQSNVVPVAAAATISQPEVPVTSAGSVGTPLETIPAGEIPPAGTGILVESMPATSSGSTSPSNTVQPHGNTGAHTNDGGLVVDIGTTKQTLVATSLTVERYAGRVPAVCATEHIAEPLIDTEDSEISMQQHHSGADTNSTGPSTDNPAASASGSPSTGLLNRRAQSFDASGSNNSVATTLAPFLGSKELVSFARGIGRPKVPVISAGAATQTPAIPVSSKRASGPTAIGATSLLAASHANGTKTLSAFTPTLPEVRCATASEKGKAPDYTNGGTPSTDNCAVPVSHQTNTGLHNMLNMLAYLNSNESEQILERAIDEIDAPCTVRTNSDDQGAGGIWIGNRSRADTVLLSPDTLSMDTMISEYLTLSRDERQRFLEAMVEWQEASPNERTAILATRDTGDTGTDASTGVLADYENTTSMDCMLSLLEYLPDVEYQQLIVDALNDIDVPRAKSPDMPRTLTRENFRVSDLLDWYHTLSREERELFIGLAMG
ncbi:hypothetical protein GGI24_001808 [Coemansia furcata]|nr:hypothetical protein GGI24_001808 [Coemansia furcata]